MSIASFLRRLFETKHSADVESRMRADWDRRAREGARHYVATLKDEWSDEEFFESGRIWIGYHILPSLDSICAGRSCADLRVLEIGCGAGRMTRGLSEIFAAVDAVDISPEMIARAKAALTDRSNIRFHVNSGSDLRIFPDAAFDFVFSAIVFQHIPSKSIIANYIKETSRVLRPGSLFKFQVQGCSIDEKDADTWVGTGFNAGEMSSLAETNGFTIESEVGAGTQEYWLAFRKSANLKPQF